MANSILDTFNRPLRDLRVSVIDRCNFRCTYCMPSEKYSPHYRFLDKKEWLRFDEIVRLVKLFVDAGVTKVRLTGGEPLLRPNLDELVRELTKMEGIEDLALTTNGSLLAEQAEKLYAAGLKRLTVSLDSLDDNVSRAMNGERAHVEQILAGIEAAGRAGFRSIKINTVIQRGINDHTLLNLVKHFKGSGHVLRFIEFMDVGNQNHWDQASVVPSREILEILQKEFSLTALEKDYRGEVADRYAFTDGSGEIGFISSVSEPFCGDCTRLRLSADGKMYTCLFAASGTDLSAPLRSGATDEVILGLIKKTWLARRDRYSEERAARDSSQSHLPKVEMFQVGG